MHPKGAWNSMQKTPEAGTPHRGLLQDSSFDNLCDSESLFKEDSKGSF
jgi:hypothetical protein